MAPKNDPNALTYPAQEQALGGERKVIEPLWDRSTEPPAITDFEAFETWSHAEIRQAIDSADPQHINDMANSWRRVTESGKAARQTFDDKMAKAKENWQGASGAAAAAKVREYTEQAEQLLVSMQLVANDLDQTEAVLREAQTKVPAVPPTGSPQTAEQARESEAEARRVMQTFYQPGVAEIDNRTPRLPQPQPVAAVAGSGVAAGDGSADGARSGGGSTDGSESAFSTNASGGAEDAATKAAAMNSALPSGTTGGLSAGESSGGLGGATSHSAGSGTSAGLAGSAVGALAAAPRLGASNGRALTGSPAASTTALGGTARTGQPMSGMFPPLARGKGDEDDERKGSDYLVAASNTSELVGDLPMATQPVLGE